MRVVFAKSVKPNNKVRFRNGTVAFARERGGVLEVCADATWHPVDAELVERIEMESPFDFMASPGHADQSFSPPEVEWQVQEYLQKLDNALAHTEYVPIARVRALVFGQWGHGKSQVMYRTASHLARHHPGVLVLQIVPESLTPVGILKALVGYLRRHSSLPESTILTLEAVRENLQDARDDRAGRLLAEALVTFSKSQNALHTCFLVDEGQVGARKSFLRFLKAIERRYADEGLLLHTLQCHTWSSIQRVKELAVGLEDVLRDAFQIHLPSIAEDQAAGFFRERLRNRADGSELAIRRLTEQLVPDGVARSLCRVAGGNPRRMLQYAGRVFEAAGQNHEATFTGTRVLAVLGQEDHPKHIGRPIYDDAALKRVLELLPQVMKRGDVLAMVLRDNIGLLLGESGTLRLKDVLGALGCSKPQADRLIEQEVDGTLLLRARQIVDDDDEDDVQTVFELAGSLRSRLFPTFGSSGSLERKQSQYQVFLNPLAIQKRASDGLAAILRIEGQTLGPPTPERLGVEAGYPLYGYKLLMRARNASTVQVPILAACLVQIGPPDAFIQHLVEGIEAGRWARVVLLHHNDRERWERWRKRQKRRFRSIQSSPRKILALEFSDWSHLVPDLDGEEEGGQGTKAARLFGDLACEADTDRPPTDAERRWLFEGISELFQREEYLPTLRDICYLPTESEQVFLDDPAWGLAGQRDEMPRTKLPNIGNRPVTPALIADLLGDYVREERKRYRRREPNESQLYRSIKKMLQDEREGLELDSLQGGLKQSLILDDHPERLLSCTLWTLRKIADDGLAEEVSGTWRWVDLPSRLTERTQHVEAALEDCGTRIESLRRYAPEWEHMEEELVRHRAAFDDGISSKPKQRLEGLDRLLGDLELLQAHVVEQERRIEGEKTDVIDQVQHQMQALTNKVSGVPLDVRRLARLDEEVERLRSSVEAFRALAEDQTGTNQRHQLEQECAALNRSFRIVQERMAPRGNAMLTDARAARAGLISLLVSGQPFVSVHVTIEETTR